MSRDRPHMLLSMSTAYAHLMYFRTVTNSYIVAINTKPWCRASILTHTHLCLFGKVTLFKSDKVMVWRMYEPVMWLIKNYMHVVLKFSPMSKF